MYRHENVGLLALGDIRTLLEGHEIITVAGHFGLCILHL